ncbi:MGMT family protein [Acaricomes phytoseiuli]|uniref:MGMT family protein n=1 Tax=Acaricomes phytoseiuli TaxID=291968 RepID=UPI00222364EB|nr:MGMT family protein [Acaricomes phytoseiuli]MCW1249013.1 MGMT family protein [Acaricomes phytoseiuli]
MNSSEARNRYRDAVRTLVGLIPAGRVLAYGDIAELLGFGGPRQVGRVMSHFGDGLPWWRVTRADGRPAEGHDERALVQYRIEETPLRYTRGSRERYRCFMACGNIPGALAAFGTGLGADR